MNTLTVSINATIRDVTLSEDALTIELEDGRSVSVPLGWYPRLLHATASERRHWRLIGKGEGIHWPDLDEDISAENILFGQLSGESARSFEAWLSHRSRKKKNTSKTR